MSRRPPWTLWFGLAVIVAAQALLWLDVQRRGGAVAPLEPIPPPGGDSLSRAARWAAFNITGVGWLAYLLVFDGLTTWLARVRRQADIAPLRTRPHRFLLAWLTSIPVWCLFDAANFYFLDAWRYHGLPPHFPFRLAGYFVAFAAISPGMFLAAQAALHLGTRAGDAPRSPVNSPAVWALVLGPHLILSAVIALVGARSGGVLQDPLLRAGSLALLLGPPLLTLARTRCPFATSFAIGASGLAWALLIAEPISCLTLWIAVFYLADPIAGHWLGGPSLIDDWRRGRWGRTAALMIGGAWCGLVWEFWNYWALAKWTYHLPFLGATQSLRYFEMPVLGFLGFLPFALECWAMLNLIDSALRHLGLRVAQPLPDAHIL